MAATASSSASASAGGNVASSSSSSSKQTSVGPKHFDISQLPSLIKDGMTAEEESIRRRKTCRFIEESGRILKLPRVAVATAMVFFHRFYAKHSFNEHDRFEVAVAALVLAGKTEESPKKLNLVIDECYKLKQKGMQAGRISAQGSGAAAAAAASSANLSLDPKGEEFMKLKERILLLERVILHTIGFELSIDHPYKFLVEQIKKITASRQVQYIHPPKSSSATGGGSSADMSMQQQNVKLTNELLSYSMNFANDSMHTSLCLQFSAEQIALSCVYLAGNFVKLKPTASSGKSTWIDVLNVTPNELNVLVSISSQIIDCITDRKGNSSNEAVFLKIRKELEKLKGGGSSSSSKDLSSSSSGPPPPPPPPPGGPPVKKQRT